MTSPAKENVKDTLGARIKRYEAENEKYLSKNLPIYARLDGRHFSKLTGPMGYPYLDLPMGKYSRFMWNMMRETAMGLQAEFKADIVETHSDEISLGWKDGSKIPFEGRYFKLVSNMASYAGALFYKLAATKHFSKLETLLGDVIRSDAERIITSPHVPSFDCRLFQVPDLCELTNCFVWRQNDCIRGTINQYAQRWFSPKQLHGKSIEDRLKMLRETGHGEYIDSADFKRLKYGSWFKVKTAEYPMPEEFKKFNQDKKTIIRHVLTEIYVDRLGPMPAQEKIDVLFAEEGYITL